MNKSGCATASEIKIFTLLVIRIIYQRLESSRGITDKSMRCQIETHLPDHSAMKLLACHVFHVCKVFLHQVHINRAARERK